MPQRAQIETFCRIRPSPRRAANAYDVDSLDKTLTVSVPRDAEGSSGPQNQRERYAFAFTDVFDSDTKQDEVFERVAAKSVRHVMEG